MSGVVVNLGALKDAAARYGNMLRAPAGAKGKVVRSTLLRVEGDDLIVDTPFVKTSLPIVKGKWSREMSVNARDFSAMVDWCAKAWKDVGGENLDVTVRSTPNSVEIRWTDGKSARSRGVPAGVSK
ncbi:MULTISPECIES: hypothetical protein [unclassified Hyphomonas]|jgi:hypothetical protein|uniref:hypothetical protein n=1 Tax=unclassified Hyphomonas TaxID=2630699 RepID=UPI000C4F38A9|nr:MULTISPECIES: hypothetical protein [unclassified Hyphomonas]MAL47433.1 hypothetical protein [Hyphomonas sp.]MAX84807.1 hypothetical protein [Hyphomonas sp.]HBN92516.1 hypothetical protein [Hyphomonas sp.]HBT34588.1 hypothetical protein [Hyphomonas sp.]HBU36026.1 hypothetical protein [Hyphomonas sp.]|tara:strand:+ start:13524 stop:13901 length:378 start_codon:yes stop_codon:yes gene_type:complete